MRRPLFLFSMPRPLFFFREKRKTRTQTQTDQTTIWDVKSNVFPENEYRRTRPSAEVLDRWRLARNGAREKSKRTRSRAQWMRRRARCARVRADSAACRDSRAFVSAACSPLPGPARISQSSRRRFPQLTQTRGRVAAPQTQQLTIASPHALALEPTWLRIMTRTC